MPDFFLVPNVWPHGVELEPAKNWWCLSHFIVFRKCWNHEILFNVWCQKVIKVIFRYFWAIVNTSKICWGLIKASEGLFNLKRKNTPNKDLEFDHAQDMPFHIGMLRCKDSDLGFFFVPTDPAQFWIKYSDTQWKLGESTSPSGWDIFMKV